MRRLLCAVGWHRPLQYTYRLVGKGGLARCKTCGKRGLVDSQGNVFMEER